jgi:U-box domain
MMRHESSLRWSRYGETRYTIIVVRRIVVDQKLSFSSYQLLSYNQRTMTTRKDPEKVFYSSSHGSLLSFDREVDDPDYRKSVEELTQEMGIVIPSEFVCPITMEIMIQPVLSRYGYTFERSTIIKWIDNSGGYCPITRKPLRLRDLIPNAQLGEKIAFWMWSNHLPMFQRQKRPHSAANDRSNNFKGFHSMLKATVNDKATKKPNWTMSA